MPVRIVRFNYSLALHTLVLFSASAAGAAPPDAKWFTQMPMVAESRTKQSVAAPAIALAAAKSDAQTAPLPQWIWGSAAVSDNDNYVFRKEFAGGSQAASLIATCDNVMSVSINGQQVARSSEWQSPEYVDVQKFIKPGPNTLLVEAGNRGGPAGLALRLELEMPNGTRQFILTDKTWLSARKEEDQWAAARELGAMGVSPWGNVFSGPQSLAGASAARNIFNVLPGFQVELLYSVPSDQGSWVSITFDDQGRLIASDQEKRGLYRITAPQVGSRQPTKVEQLDVNITAAQGMLFAFDSLYLSVNGGPGSGLYRARDTNGDDQYDEVKLLKPILGGGEHGPHALRLSPDGKSIYLVCGNHTRPPENFNSSRVPSNWDEDLLLPRQWDARGHARGILAPGGWIAKTDPDGTSWEIFSSGYRNTYDMDFNADGELFTYDADMEWDFGTPWYRPTRLCHATSGSEFGWRSGTGKWPAYYVDSLPPVIDIGPGSPVGVAFGTGAKFPAKYQRALYLLDWTFGTIYAVHLTPDGASYSGVKEEFLSRTPLPLTDVAIGPDGALYFTVGGRGAQSALYRVTYVGDEPTGPVDCGDGQFAELRALRRQLEEFHVKRDPAAIDIIWPNLAHADRFIRFAARTALEHQDVKQWQDRALTESDPAALITALVALARQGEASLQPELLAALDRIDFAELTEGQQLELLRLYQLACIRMGRPDPATASRIARHLDAYYPAAGDGLNRELCTLLVYLNSPTVITKTLSLMQRPATTSGEDLAELLERNMGYGGTIAKMLANLPEIQNMHYAFALRNMRYGWTLVQRKQYFDWFNTALQRSGGASYEGFVNNIRNEALANVSPAERKALEATTIEPPPAVTELPQPKGPGKDWTLSEVIALAESGLQGRDFENGKRTYAAARCAACHRFDGEGGATGPDLTNVAGRFNIHDLTEALIEPSKVVPDQYRASVIVTVDGQVITGRILSEDSGRLSILTDPFDATQVVKLNASDIEETLPSPTSLMPTGLLTPLNQDEVLDLLAYLLSRGNPNDLVYHQSP